MKKSKHYQMSWDIFKAVEVVEQYEQATGDTSGQIPYRWLKKIYNGALLDALQFGKIKPVQRYGVTFKAKIEREDGTVGTAEYGFKIDEPMLLSELINGKDDVKVKKDGFTIRGWRGAKDEWLDIMDSEFKNDLCLEAHAVVNCLVRG